MLAIQKVLITHMKIEEHAMPKLDIEIIYYRIQNSISLFIHMYRER